jgi:hypothetical protein
MPVRTEVEINQEQLKALQEKLGKGFMNQPRRDFLASAVEMVRGQVVSRMPVDTGAGMGSIGTEVDPAERPVWAKVFTNEFYIRFLEYGTGVFSEKGNRHWPSAPEGGKLDIWARQRGFTSGAQVARIIGLRGGLPARRFFREGLKAARGAVKGLLERLADEIERAWEK